MRKAGITQFIPADEVKAVVSTVLMQKTHSGTSLSLNDIQHIFNKQCIELGEPLDSNFDLSLTPDRIAELVDPAKVKWQICQNFSEVNKVSDVAPMPQGDINAKQQ
jgi:hypothetical protein